MDWRLIAHVCDKEKQLSPTLTSVCVPRQTHFAPVYAGVRCVLCWPHVPLKASATLVRVATTNATTTRTILGPITLVLLRTIFRVVG